MRKTSSGSGSRWIPNNISFAESMDRQITIAQRTEHYDAVFLIRDPNPMLFESFLHELERKVEGRISIVAFSDPKRLQPAQLSGFLQNILNPSHLDNNTLDDLRELVAKHVFSYYLHREPDSLEEYVSFEEFVHWFESVQWAGAPAHHPKSCNILRIFHRNLQRHKPMECPKMELLRDEYVDYAMVWDMLSFIQFQLIEYEAQCIVNVLPTLYKLMDSNATATSLIWDKARYRWDEFTDWIAFIVEFVSRKIGLNPNIDGLSDEELVVKVKAIAKKITRICNNLMKADVYKTYWKDLYALKKSGFSGRIAIVNRDFALTDPWIQSLFAIFGRNNIVISSVKML